MDRYMNKVNTYSRGGGGGGSPSLPLETVPDARERKKTRKKGIQIRVGRGKRRPQKGYQNHRKWENGIQTATVRV